MAELAGSLLYAHCRRSRPSAFLWLQRGAAGSARRGLNLWRSPLRADSTAMLALGSRRRTHCVRCALCVRTTAPSQSTKRAARADPRPVLLVAPEIAPTGHCLPRCTAGVSPGEHRRVRKGAFGQVAQRLWSAEKHRARGLARSAKRQLTRRGCSNAANEVSEVSSATGPRDRASQGSRRAAPTAPVKRSGLPGRAFAVPTVARTADVQGQQWAECRPSHPISISRRGARQTRWSQ